jgi:hypothetical protein
MRAFRKRMRVHVTGEGVPDCIGAFGDMAGGGSWGRGSVGITTDSFMGCAGQRHGVG